MSTLSIRIPDMLHQDLQALSRSQNRTMSDLVRESIHRRIAAWKFRALRNLTLPFAEAQGIFADADVFRVLK
jgi:predicted transcriptional regulator